MAERIHQLENQWRSLAIGEALVAAAVDIVGVLVLLPVLLEFASQVAYQETSLQVVFLSMEKLANTLTNIGGFGLYSLAGILLLPAVFSTPDFPRWLRWLGVVEWSISILATALLLIAPGLATGPLLVSFMLYAPRVWGCAWWLWKIRAEN